jgi:hypothetical protein
LQIAGRTKLVDSPPSTPATTGAAVAAFLAESMGHFIMFSVIKIYNKKIIGLTLMNCSQPQEN